MTKAIEVRDLSYRYEGSERDVLLDVNLEVEKGEFVLLTGASGCGKTTLCRCFNGLIPHFYSGDLRGEVYVAGLSVKDTPIHKLALKVGFVFQNPDSQLFSLTVERDVAFGLENLGIDRDEMRLRVDWALKTVGMEKYRYAAPYELSGGQRQRVAIAAVLAMRPEVIVLDEPTAYLDPKTALKIFQLLDGLNKRMGLTVVLVEHRLDLVSRYASRLVVMNKGRIILDGKPSTLFHDELEEYGINVPRLVRFFRKLEEMGYEFGELPLTTDEAAEVIRRIMA
ncbi:energy-coupling factor transporter ATPase [Candidatus Bathyarchaeota archaeon]|nr:energy-coupling factor transporter ATPase [Candidatus Bathyarchaeota archaeon]